MKTNKTFWSVSAVILIVFVSAKFTFADDINPPPYRGAPLSVYTHWSADASGQLSLDQFLWADDGDPSTYIAPFQPFVIVEPTAAIYDFRIPNFIDQLPLKLLRLQLTWSGTTQPPIGIAAWGYDGGQTLPGVATFTSSPLVFTQPDGGYQYFDIEFKPNPDFERLYVQLAPDEILVQAVIDTISTIPEPATMLLLTLGGFVLRKRR